ncbi:diguanylate cyclase [Mycolicibacterium sp. 018/SC-01/001]|uniref:diguanylate cyclase domain-containing protein n=1 Tax=Mycolicibacterium sp. 018/SC-01/001 TaxID=2592069 RepID=UPI0011812B88|nr:diguanylate cyclase [Mycolicibacterium sp. 018/SC-01/001]TRW89075.1 diguanylate cyclase [Mycolicibacterium sp. 018/SC-01/001]
MSGDSTDATTASVGGAADAEQRLRALFDLASDGICVHQDRVIVFANTTAQRWIGGQGHGGLVGRPVTDFIPADLMPMVERRLSVLHRDGDNAPPTEVTMSRSRGAMRDVEATSIRIDWNGRPAIVTYFRDLTTSRAAELLRYQAALLDHVSDGVVGLSPNGTVSSWNAAAEKIYGRTAQEVHNRPVHEAVGAEVDAARLIDTLGVLHTTHTAADGSPRFVRLTAARTSSGFVLICADMTALRRAERHFEAVVTALDAGVVVFHPDGSVMSANPAAQRILAAVRPIDAPFASDVPMVDEDGRPLPVMQQPVWQAAQSGVPQVDRVLGIDCEDGVRVWLSMSTRLLSPDDPMRSPVVATFVDITAQKVAHEKAAHEAAHDLLTGLLNRSGAFALIAASLRPDAARRLSAVLFIDLDDLKSVNDSFGHDAGDAVLVATSARMKRALRESDVIARLAGDEFVVLLMQRIDQADLDQLVERLHCAATDPIMHGDVEITVTASIGVTLVGVNDVRDALELLRAADEAMYSAKTSGRGRTRYAV